MSGSPCAAARPPRLRAGLTLVETLLALALFTLLGLYLAGIVRSALGIWESGERRGRGDLEFAAALERLRADVRALHAGPRGWLVLDRWEARAATGTDPAWWLPRLRFLARGGGLREADPEGLTGVEVEWLLLPEDAERSRLARLVRLALPESPDRSLRDDDAALDMARAVGLTVLDGVAWLQLDVVEASGERRDEARIEADQPYGFPVALEVALERVTASARRNPTVLDAEIGAEPTRLLLRGAAPLRAPPFALVEREWMEIRGAFPAPGAALRGVRGTIPAGHPRGAVVWLPEAYSGRCGLPAGGRRVP